MLLHPYNIKSAELPPPTSQEDYYRNLVGYTDYKILYDAFVDASATFAADNALWNNATFAGQKALVETLIQDLCNCAYVQYKLVAMKECSASRLAHVPTIYGRMLTDMIFQSPQ